MSGLDGTMIGGKVDILGRRAGPKLMWLGVDVMQMCTCGDLVSGASPRSAMRTFVSSVRNAQNADAVRSVGGLIGLKA